MGIGFKLQITGNCNVCNRNDETTVKVYFMPSLLEEITIHRSSSQKSAATRSLGQTFFGQKPKYRPSFTLLNKNLKIMYLQNNRIWSEDLGMKFEIRRLLEIQGWRPFFILIRYVIALGHGCIFWAECAAYQARGGP